MAHTTAHTMGLSVLPAGGTAGRAAGRGPEKGRRRRRAGRGGGPAALALALALAAPAGGTEVALQAGWPGTPLLHEALEGLGQVERGLFWKFVDAWDDAGAVEAGECAWDRALALATSGLTEAARRLFAAALETRMYSAAVERNRMAAYDVGMPDACCWANVEGHRITDPGKVAGQLEAVGKDEDRLYLSEDFDHEHTKVPGTLGVPTAILYGPVGGKCTRAFHEVLAAASEKHKVHYVYRPAFGEQCASEVAAGSCIYEGTGGPARLAGYGVEVVIKSTEYTALDDRDAGAAGAEEPGDLGVASGVDFGKLADRYPHLAKEIGAFAENVRTNNTQNLSAREVWALERVGLQTVQAVTRAEDPLRTLAGVTASFPSFVEPISLLEVDGDLKAAEERVVSHGDGALLRDRGKSRFLVNGVAYGAKDLHLYPLLDTVRAELDFFARVDGLGLGPEAYGTVQDVRLRRQGLDEYRLRLDMRQVDTVQYINDVAKDQVYSHLDRDVAKIVVRKGKAPTGIRKNLYSAVFVMDPFSPIGLYTMNKMWDLYQKKKPVRMGMLMVQGMQKRKEFVKVPEKVSLWEDSMKVTATFLLLKQKTSALHAFKFLRETLEKDSAGETPFKFDVFFRKAQKAYVDYHQSPATAVKTPKRTDMDEGELAQQAGLMTAMNQVVFENLGNQGVHYGFFVNGVVHGHLEELEVLDEIAFDDAAMLERAVQVGDLTNDTDVEDFLYADSFPTLDFSLFPETLHADVRIKYLAEIAPEVFTAIANHGYLHGGRTAAGCTHWVLVDVKTRVGRETAIAALEYILEGDVVNGEPSDVRLALVPTFHDEALGNQLLLVAEKLLGDKYLAAEFLVAAFRKIKKEHLADEKWRDKPDILEEVVEVAASVLPGVTNGAVKDALTHKNRVLSMYCLDLLQQAFGGAEDLPRSMVISNGRALELKKPLTVEGFESLSQLINRQLGGSLLRAAVEKADAGGWRNLSDQVVTLFVLCAEYLLPGSPPVAEPDWETWSYFPVLADRYPRMGFQHPGSDPALDVRAIVNPFAPEAARLASLLEFCRDKLGATVTAMLSMPGKPYEAFPVQSFYRYAAAPQAAFDDLPGHVTLSVQLDAPAEWSVVAKDAGGSDLYNLRLERVRGPLRVLYELDALLIASSIVNLFAKDQGDFYPDGMQLQLQRGGRTMDDTTLLAGGYYQVRAKPGRYDLHIPDGCSSDIFDFAYTYTATQDVFVPDILGRPSDFPVLKNETAAFKTVAECQNVTAANATEGPGNKPGWFGGLFSKGRDDTVHVFSLASGHMYERLLRIMVLSVRKTTRRPLKFWFLRNYASPAFAEYVDSMSREYGFSYDFLTYQWPDWLNPQAELQRRMWAYKILFLDVLFPLDVSRVIFVDADQVVRADLGELYDMDLGGKPYGYVPFCADKPEMDGFRFWKDGFWKKHLGDKPYHISALYVVDLDTFRRTGAGDRLRALYNKMSTDTNALSNLDQDLPNYAQDEIPIHSLPQEWLYCDSWCHADGLKRAKTIDLCNNPKTKEPKLDGARRTVAEWPKLDTEQHRHVERVDAGRRRRADAEL